jgi:DNA-directed RNA polymerase subunit M/transcription elongation factor TFIIS
VYKVIDASCSTYPAWRQLESGRREALVRRIERDCFNKAINLCIDDGTNRLFTDKTFVDRYSAICSRVIANLDMTGPVGSDYLVRNIINGAVDPRDVASLTSFELCPQASSNERKDIELRQMQKVPNKVSRAYKCKKCGGNETIPIEYQGRSADEGSSRSIKCVICGYIWRFS